ncbi:uncharacterized protein ARMOST_11659 [Armillaria ostoyae]|uniref:Uncharacterized protein n=1 Tax=Armillaria ostoyae TaxID=47428 RepID=A0A284RHR9_ARMOS|nr:uncharacterized protein ARMOST_11659 [Armillaria ostoyae]
MVCTEPNQLIANPRQWILHKVPVFIYGRSLIDDTVYTPAAGNPFMRYNTFLINLYVSQTSALGCEAPEEAFPQLKLAVKAMSRVTQYLTRLEWCRASMEPENLEEINHFWVVDFLGWEEHLIELEEAKELMWACDSEEHFGESEGREIVIHCHQLFNIDDGSMLPGVTRQVAKGRICVESTSINKIHKRFAPCYMPEVPLPQPDGSRTSDGVLYYPFMEYIDTLSTCSHLDFAIL